MATPVAPKLTAEERRRVEEMLAGLRACGYVKTDRHQHLAVGTRVRHRGHQWSEALCEGTGNVVAITHKPDSAWSREWGMPDVEMVVVWDQPRPFEDSSRLSQLAQYHVTVIGGEA